MGGGGGWLNLFLKKESHRKQKSIRIKLILIIAQQCILHTLLID